MSKSHANGIMIRVCRVDEVQEVLDLWQSAEAIPTVTDTAKDLERMLSRGVVLVAEAGGNLVGSVIGVFDGWRANIYRLAVHPSCRRRGIARSLVDELERRLIPDGARRIAAVVHADHPQAVGFWDAQGYTLQKRTVRYTKEV